jgi:histidine triad (HIT) family protein
MPSIFSRIVNKEIPCHLIAENEEFLAFLDIMPLAEGHTLVIPKKEIDYVFDLEDATLSGLMLFCKEVALKIQKAIPCLRIGVAVIGLEVPHAHVHLVPLNSMNDINFNKDKLKFTHPELAEIAKKIREQ